MKRPAFALITLLATPFVAFAHPGHPGHDFGWDFAGGHWQVPLLLTTTVTVIGFAYWSKRRRRDS